MTVQHILSILFAAATVAAVGLARAPDARALKAYPVDEAGKDIALETVRDRLLAAVRRRDVEATLALMSADVKLSLGDASGHAHFRKMVVRTPGLWSNLEWALRNGGRFGGGGEWFAAPYTAEARLGRIEPFDALIVVARGVPLHAGPAAASRIVARLSYDVVEMLDPPGQRGPVWLKVRTPGGAVGWLDKRHGRSPVDYRVVFRRIGGEWVVVSFLSGD
jgi:hypothetical protein